MERLCSREVAAGTTSSKSLSAVNILFKQSRNLDIFS